MVAMAGPASTQGSLGQPAERTTNSTFPLDKEMDSATPIGHKHDAAAVRVCRRRRDHSSRRRGSRRHLVWRRRSWRCTSCTLRQVGK